ncbi:chloride channel protein [Nocardia sp. NPDC050630]|uniref:chloride channel protein n=1 Tax=Nocardia sp. NPDC050630 TaxID=3364321 RepID=UPI0037B3A019
MDRADERRRARRSIPPPQRVSALRWLRESSWAAALMAVPIGAISGFGGVAFRYLVAGFTWVFTGRADYPGLDRVAGTPWPDVWFLLLAPVVAGAVYGPILHRFAADAHGHGVPEVIHAVAEHDGRIAPRATLVRAFASAVCIGGGGSVGLIGPVAQIGSATGSAVAQTFRLDASRMRLLVACGAAGGVAAAVNAPLAGAFLALELILRSYTVESVVAVALSSAAASVIGRVMRSDEPLLSLPQFAVHDPVEYVLYPTLGITAGVVGVCFSKVLFLVRRLCDRVWRGPEWARPAVGGLALGAMLLALPQLYGVGYPALEAAISGRYAIGLVLVLLVAKMLATSLTLGIGGSGGVFAPTLFIGTMAGVAFGDIAHHLLPDTTTSAGAYGLIGMGAALSAATRAPITAVTIVFELTGEYPRILPLLAAVTMATLTARLLSKDTICTRTVSRDDTDVERAH